MHHVNAPERDVRRRPASISIETRQNIGCDRVPWEFQNTTKKPQKPPIPVPRPQNSYNNPDANKLKKKTLRETQDDQNDENSGNHSDYLVANNNSFYSAVSKRNVARQVQELEAAFQNSLKIVNEMYFSYGNISRSQVNIDSIEILKCFRC